MSDNVVPLHPQPPSELVVKLEHLLKQARAGEIAGALIVYEKTDGTTAYRSTAVNRFLMLTYLNRLSHKINQSLDDSEVEVSV